MNIGLIQSILSNDIINQISKIPFKQNQIVNGKVLKLFKGNLALLQIGSLNVFAELQAPLQIQRNYFFQVHTNGTPIKLKMVEQIKHNQPYHKATIAQLAKLFSLDNNAYTNEILKYFLENGLPLSKEMIINATKWLQNSKNMAVDLQAIRLIITRELPQTAEVFKAIQAVFDETPFREGIKNILSYLPKDDEKYIRLKELMNKFQELDSILSSLESKFLDKNHLLGRNQFAHLIKDMAHLLGLQHEFNIFRNTASLNDLGKFDTLKPILIEIAQSTSDVSVKTTAEFLVDKITGLQLHSSVNSPVQQFLIQIPFQLGGNPKDLIIQWSGGKSKQNKLDPNYCRIIIFLDLEMLRETILDIQIQNRIINITVMNDKSGLKETIEKYQQILKDHFSQMNYILSSIKVRNTTIKEEQSKDQLFIQNSYHGVDIRI